MLRVVAFHSLPCCYFFFVLTFFLEEADEDRLLVLLPLLLLLFVLLSLLLFGGATFSSGEFFSSSAEEGDTNAYIGSLYRTRKSPSRALTAKLSKLHLLVTQTRIYPTLSLARCLVSLIERQKSSALPNCPDQR